jgi:hypothetical protein
MSKINWMQSLKLAASLAVVISPSALSTARWGPPGRRHHAFQQSGKVLSRERHLEKVPGFVEFDL